jgi:hypothetical protein
MTRPFVGGGPAEECENAERNSQLLQEALYSGYKKHQVLNGGASQWDVR